VQANVARRRTSSACSPRRRSVRPLDILVNQCGVYEFSPLEGVTDEHFHKQFDLNVLGLLLASKEALKHFDPSGGSIVNISSGVSTLTPANASVYGHQGAVDAVTRSLAKRAGPAQDSRQPINPGMWKRKACMPLAFTRATSASSSKRRPARRIGQTEDVAPAVVFLASGDSATSPRNVLITGGLR